MKTIKSPRETIRAHCVACSGGCKKEVATCDGDGKAPGFKACDFHPFRLGRGRPSMKIMRKFCLQCMGGSYIFVKECKTEDCLVHPYRFGKNPAMARNGKNSVELTQIRATKRPFVKGISVRIERSDNGLNEAKHQCARCKCQDKTAAGMNGISPQRTSHLVAISPCPNKSNGTCCGAKKD
jgi:hypothetical protein